MPNRTLPTRKSVSRNRTRTRRSVGAARSVRVVPAAPRAALKNRRAYFDLAAPRLTLNPWKTKRDWRASRPKFLALVLIIALAAALSELFNADTFFVADVALVGNRILPRSEIEQTIGIRGWSIFFVEPRAVESALERLPEVKDAQVELSLPNQLRIRISERQPRFIWESQGASYWVDDDGIAFRVRGNYPGLLRLRDAENLLVKPGKRVNEEAFNAAVSLRNAWPRGPAAFEWTRTRGLAAREEHGWLVYFGRASQMSDKLAALQVVTVQILRDKKPIEFIDLGNGLPYFREVTVVQAANVK